MKPSSALRYDKGIMTTTVFTSAASSIYVVHEGLFIGKTKDFYIIKLVSICLHILSLCKGRALDRYLEDVGCKNETKFRAVL